MYPYPGGQPPYQAFVNPYPPPHQPFYGQPQQPVVHAPQHAQPPNHHNRNNPSRNGPPPKKQKTVVTRYGDPPPGYQAPYQQQQHVASTPYGAPSQYSAAPPFSAPPPYAVPQAYAAQPPPFQPPHAYQTFQPNPGYPLQAPSPYPPQPAYDPNQAYQQPPYQPYASVPSASAFEPPSLPSTTAPMLAAPTPYAQENVSSQFDAWQEPTTQPESEGEAEILTFDWDGEVGIPAEHITPELSLGLIIWHPPKRTVKPLPSVFTDADLETFTASDETVKEEESISKYFRNDTIHQVRFTVAATREWENVKDDMVFVKFSRTGDAHVSTTTMKANRARAGDRTWSKPLPSRPVTAEPEQVVSPPSAGVLPSSENGPSAKLEYNGEESDGDQAMDMSDEDDDYEPPKQDPISVAKPPMKLQPQAAPVNVLDSLERSINASNFSRNNSTIGSRNNSTIGSRNNSVVGRQPSLPPRARYSRSRSPEKYQAKPSNLPRDANQESLLAALGVEGSPKMMYPTPGPAVAPPEPPALHANPRAWAQQHNSSLPHNPFGQHGMNNRGFAYGPGVAPPPPPRAPPSPSNPWKVHGVESPRSTTSQHTAQGSDFAPEDYEDQDATPKAKVPAPRTAYERAQQQPHNNLKRSYRDDDDRDDRDSGRKRQVDDTPRATRKPKYDRTDAYSRHPYQS